VQRTKTQEPNNIQIRNHNAVLAAKAAVEYFLFLILFGPDDYRVGLGS